MKRSTALLAFLALTSIETEGVQLPAKTTRGRIRQTALLLGIPSWTAAQTRQQSAVDHPPSPGSPYFPVIPSLDGDPAYSTSPLFRSRMSLEEIVIFKFESTLPYISVIQSLRNNKHHKKQIIVKRLLVLALAAGIGLAPILASPQRAQARDIINALRQTQPEVSLLAENMITGDVDHLSVGHPVLNKLISRKSAEMEADDYILMSTEKSSGGIDKQRLLSSTSVASSGLHQTRGGHYEASTAIISNGFGKQVQTAIPYLSMKLTAVAVLVAAAITGGLEEATQVIRRRHLHKIDEKWIKRMRENLPKCKDLDFCSLFHRFFGDKTDNASKPRKITPAGPKGVLRLTIVQSKIHQWKQRGQGQKFMLQKTPSKYESLRIMLKRSVPVEPVDAFSSPLFSPEPQLRTPVKSRTEKLHQVQQKPMSPNTSELQSKYSTKYVALQRNPDSPILTYRIDDRPNTPKQPTVNIGLKRTNTTATVY